MRCEGVVKIKIFQKYALDFDGLNTRQYIIYNVGTNFQYIQSKFTMVGWYKANSVQRSENIYPYVFQYNFAQRLAISGVGCLQMLYRYEWYSGGIYSSIGTSSYHILDDTWHMFTVVKDEENVFTCIVFS